MSAEAFQSDNAPDQLRSLFGGSQGIAFDIVSRRSQEFCHLPRVRGDHHAALLSFQCFRMRAKHVNAAASSTKFGPTARLKRATESSTIASSSVIPGPIKTASQPDASSTIRELAAGSIPPREVTGHPTTIASGIAISR